jgi:hypothetical protein
MGILQSLDGDAMGILQSLDGDAMGLIRNSFVRKFHHKWIEYRKVISMKV